MGSSNVITDKDGKQIGLTEFSPYGSVSKQNGTYDPKYKFTGKELDNTGLYFYGARYYDSQLGRFITADSIVQAPYDPQSLNRYSYCRNNPINYIDPTGHSWWSKFWKSFGSTVLSIIGVALAPFTAGASLYLTYAATIWSGVQAAHAGQFGMWAAGFAVSMALGFALPVSNFENPLMQIGVGALRGAAIGAVSGGVASVVGGGSFGAGATQGAIGGAEGGAISAFFTSQQYLNSAEGYGFKSNNDVMDVLGKEGRFQEAIDYASKKYDLPSEKYDPNNPNFGVTNMRTGEVTYGQLAFSGRSQLQATGFNEGRHVSQFQLGKVAWDSNRTSMVNKYSLEVDAGVQTLRNAWKLNLTSQAIQDERAYLRENSIRATWENQGVN